MRITLDLLHKIARETIKKRQRSEPDLLAAYLTGSLLDEEPLLGGTTDIDLVLVHKFQIPTPREAIRITPEVSLDIIHKLREDFDQHKQLRHDPWLGYPLTRNHILLFDTDHWLEFIQAGVSAQFHRVDNVLARVNSLSGKAREIWFELLGLSPEEHLIWLDKVLRILDNAANAVVGLTHRPLTTRRFLLAFAEQTSALGVPKILAGFLGLIGANEENIQTDVMSWCELLGKDLAIHTNREPKNTPVHLSPCRHRYYLNGIQALAESGHAAYAIWPLLRIWTDVQLHRENEYQNEKAWQTCLEMLSLSPEAMDMKNEALDAFLDTIEITIETWADEYGF